MYVIFYTRIYLSYTVILQSDAVVSSIADRMNISKADILNPESDNTAVKLALAETHVIQETKSFLEANGVVLSALSGPRVARSDTTILVKNIPYGTSADQIRELFEPHGQLSRVLVPPAGTMAVVEFVHPDEGRKAFKAVAYRRLGNSIIYLEKGPVGMFAGPPDAPAAGPVTAVGVQPITVADATEGKDAEEPAVAAGTTLFVKNLSFATTADRFTAAFRNLPEFAFARVQTKPDPKRPGARLSMGYGFLGFKSADAAKKALKSLQGYVLDGHALVVKFAGRGTEEDTEKDTEKAKARTTKMIVKNVPFEATKKDIRDLFGCVRSCLLSCRIFSDAWGVVHTGNSSPSGFRRNSTTARAASRSSSSSPGTRPRTRTRPSSTRTCSVAILSSNGPRKIRTSTSTSCARRRASGLEVARRCQAGRGSWSWVMTTVPIWMVICNPNFGWLDLCEIDHASCSIWSMLDYRLLALSRNLGKLVPLFVHV